jgi:chemotaxis response regulator CheB
MPQAAIKLHAVDRVVTLPHMAAAILHALNHPKVK